MADGDGGESARVVGAANSCIKPKGKQLLSSYWQLLVLALEKVKASRVGFASLGVATVFMVDFMTAVGFYLTVIFMPVFFQVCPFQLN